METAAHFAGGFLLTVWVIGLYIFFTAVEFDRPWEGWIVVGGLSTLGGLVWILLSL